MFLQKKKKNQKIYINNSKTNQAIKPQDKGTIMNKDI